MHRARAIIALLTTGLLVCCSATDAFAGPCDAAGGTPAKPEINRAAPSPAAAAGPGSYGIARNRINAEATRALRTDSKGRLAVVDHRALIEGEFRRFDPDYEGQRNLRLARIADLKIKLFARFAKGESLPCSAQRLAEAEWLAGYTALWTRTDVAIARLEASLTEADQAFAGHQAEDGEWGQCRTEWLFRLDDTVDALDALYGQNGAAARPPRPLHFLERIREPYRLTELMTSKLVSPIAASGVYGREEIASLYESTSQLLFKSYLRDMAAGHGAPFLDARYRDLLERFIDTTQDPVSGFWGPIVAADRELSRFVDLSMTYHIIAYRRGCVGNWPAIASTLFAIRDLDYPFGWRFRGRPNAHNNYDVIRILKYAWPHLDADQRRRAQAEIAEMVDWATRVAVAPDGRIPDEPDFYTSPAAADYFTVSFLDEAGYFSSSAPFWGDHAVAHAAGPALCRLLKERMAALAPRFEMAAAALGRLASACP